MDSHQHDELDFHKHIAVFSEATTRGHLVKDVLPLIDGIRERLEAGDAQVLDVGCGRGMHMAEFGKKFFLAVFFLCLISTRRFNCFQVYTFC